MTCVPQTRKISLDKPVHELSNSELLLGPSYLAVTILLLAASTSRLSILPLLSLWLRYSRDSEYENSEISHTLEVYSSLDELLILGEGRRILRERWRRPSFQSMASWGLQSFPMQALLDSQFTFRFAAYRIIGSATNWRSRRPRSTAGASSGAWNLLRSTYFRCDASLVFHTCMVLFRRAKATRILG